ncbi:alpha-2-macroglobulin [Flavivirga sp. 57AJ16]|uniref:alpha-2-macroglobulin family protein n=1 Tax=Flavivirga sp. 57AJ16 TaxID=3025307 RepID=UPI002367268F|nr:MG2 domain-containing protein [Flavivirga sp. 57AJ16]MDD7886410.1 MG2 domain-containing protein [Flavivirga sp. 57AJ16]
MKNILSLLMIILFAAFSNAQNNTYEDLWTQIEQFETKGLPQSALKTVEDIKLLAEKDKNTPQLIKSMFFKSKYALVLEEDAQLKIIKDFKDEIKKSTFPAKNVLESILANMYWQYFSQNRWKLYNRTKTAVKVDASDFRTWDLQTLFDEIHRHYQNSLQNGLLLQLEPLGHYDAILKLQKSSRIYRPTLFDLLSHNALLFYKTDETHITKPAYKFEIDDPTFLGNAEVFSKLKIASKDTMSLQLNALKIYQDLINFHLKDKKPFALADVNIERLKFVNRHATFNDKESLLLNVLKTERDLLKSHEVSTLYDYEIATAYNQQGANYQPKTNEDNRWKIKDAIDICNKAILKFPKSKGAKKCTVLKQQIKQQTLQITTEKFLPIQQNARLLIRYKNLNQLQFKIFELTRNQLSKFDKIYREDEQLAFIKKLDTYKDWDYTLRNESDYQIHTTEILVPKLNNGSYLIFASPKNEAETFAFSTVQVTNLALVDTETTNNKIFQIINRNNGKPIENATVKFSYHKNYEKDNKITETKTSNQFGEMSLPKSNVNYNDLNIEVIYNGEKAYFGEYYVSRYYKQQQEKVRYNAFLFTDRSIYRPGQTVHFKAITLKTEDGKSEVLANEKVYAILYNTNGEELKQLKFKTNEFGSISGEFILPNNGLNGQYYIQFGTEAGHNMNANTYFSVEEYKRPKFETSFNPVTETYKVNDSVTIKGHALSYAGSHITDAKVVYRVHRKVEYPRWYYWHYPWFNSEPQEITHGESMTDNKGMFKITFKAIPDQSVDKTNLPIFKYEVTADVTDLNGETRSATTTINVGYHALTANMSIANLIDKTKKNNVLEIDTRNLNGAFVPAKGTVKIYKLNAPKSVLRQRPWEAPDYQEFSQEVFNKWFPHDAYKDEHLTSNWEKGALVFIASFNTETTKKLNLGKIKKWESGAYIIILESKDKFGQLVKDEIKTTLHSPKDKTVADKKLFFITTNKSSYKTGETVLITLGSAASNLNVSVQIEKDRKVVKTHIIQLSNNRKTISVPVNNEDIGGFTVNYSFAAFNSFQSGGINIPVPYPNMDLDIETTTFRNKLQPGTEETWSFKVKGPQGDKVSAELLASMYDASLDQFKSHTWPSNLINRPIYYSHNPSNAHQSFGTGYFRVYNKQHARINDTPQYYDQLNWFGFYFGNNNSFRTRGVNSFSRAASASMVPNEIEVEESVALMNESDGANLDEIVTVGYGTMEKKEITGSSTTANSEENINPNEKPNLENIKIRKNLQETAFFFPQLKTDPEGNVSFSFTTPEALTQWRLQLLAHTQTLESTTKTLTAVTQKELMVVPNAPRFLREGDRITISTKIVNLTEKQLSGQAKLILTDPISGEDISTKLIKSSDNSSLPLGEMAKPERAFTVNAKGNTQVSWYLSIPDNVQAVQYKIIAKSEDFSDGEQNALPVLSNRMLVTETLPMWVRSNQTKTFTLDKLKNTSTALSAGSPTTLKNHKLTLEITSNPAWYAVQALPYLMEYPYACNEQTFSRYYANALASHIANSNPRIQDVFNQWKSQDVLISNLEKNETLKSILIQETPWLRDAQSEAEQKKRMALLFDLNKMNNELQSALRKLENNQMSSGAWAWFDGGRENRYITQHIITGFGHLNKLGVTLSTAEESHNQMISKAVKYLDAQFVKEYQDIRKYNAKIDLNKDHLSYTQLHYLYMRSFYPDIKKSKEVDKIMQYYQTQIQKYWLSRPLYAKGLMALVSYRNNDSKTAHKILKSLKETSITSDELGMYWKENTNSWHWYQAPIETQALLIEAFSEAGHAFQSPSTSPSKDSLKHLEIIDNLKIWLLKNKQTNSWKTTKATTDAVYALLLQGSDWLSVTEMVDVVLGGQNIAPSKLENVKVEAGTGYYKTSWSASEIKPEMAEVKLTKKGKGIAWGSLYWQYFEDLDKITLAETPLKLKKKLFLKQNTDTGETISEITKNTPLKVGDLVRVRIELRSDRNMEFIHMKDMRAAGLEPVNVFSQYKWQDDLGYYESTKDASTNFFFDFLPKGIYVFEYDLRVNNAGNMSNGITTIQSMYAPEFSSHSEGIRLLVK